MATNANKMANTVKATVNKGAKYVSSNRFIMILVSIFVFFVVGMIVYWIYKAISSRGKGDSENPILVNDTIDASDPENSKSFSLPLSSSANSPELSFTISFWMYIADWSYRVNEPKAILIKGLKKKEGVVSGEDGSPSIWLAPDTNSLVVGTRVYRKDQLQLCNISNIPIQKWTHVVYVLDVRTVDIYINGKLERSCVLGNVPQLNNGKLNLFPRNPRSVGTKDYQTGYLGQLSGLRYFSSAMKPVDVVRLYNEGPRATATEKAVDHDGDSDDVNGGDCPSGVYPETEEAQKKIEEANELLRDAMEKQQEEQQEGRPTTTLTATWPGTSAIVSQSTVNVTQTTEPFSHYSF